MTDVLPLDRFPHILFKGVTTATVTLSPEKCDTPARHTCLMCGSPDLSWRAKTCSGNCRKSLSRRTESINRDVDAIRNAFGNLERYADRWPDLYREIMGAISDGIIAGQTVCRKVAPKGDRR